MLASPRADAAPVSADVRLESDLPPADWPANGPIELQLHDLPHASSTLEWWYVNCHVATSEGRELSLFAAFFRQLVGTDENGVSRYAHSVTWAICEPAAAAYESSVVVDSLAPELGLLKLQAGAGPSDPRLSNALREVLERGRIPGPTRLFEGRARVSEHELCFEVEGNRFSKLPSGDYQLELHDPSQAMGCALTFRPLKPAVRFGGDGVVNGVADEKMFYYFIPRCDVTGELFSGGKRSTLVAGSGWYDHEFGVAPRRRPALRAVKGPLPQTSWRWVSLQLDDGSDVSVYIITRGDQVLDNWAVITDPSGRPRAFSGAELRPLKTWRSTRSFVEYPIAWTLEVPRAELSLRIEAVFADQEVLTIIADPGFWEGRVDTSGKLRGASVSGRGWAECKGFRYEDMDGFLSAVGKEVRACLARVLPLDPAEADLAAWAGRRESSRAHDAVRGVDAQLLTDHLARPIREMTDRGGKAWRSYAALACIDVVGGDSRKFHHWLAMPELLHVGSLIVDDVEDQSRIRRGGPACHVTFGEACAINAGSAAYFLAEPPVERDSLPLADKLRIYQLYFEAMRAGHAGQALDLGGCSRLASEAARTGHSDALESHVLAVHRFKTAIPAGSLARIGAVLGGGTTEQVEALGVFFEALGLAFQITDDVLNLRGFEDNLKERGEDIRQGKVTLPVAKGFRRLPPEQRQWLWETLQARPQDARVVELVIERLEGVGAIEACVSSARALVEQSWAKLDPLLPDSQYKLIFRAFSAFILERHY
jgi:geranylgeranyl pyrophosphate synthase/predicted secreted hydrolase